MLCYVCLQFKSISIGWFILLEMIVSHTVYAGRLDVKRKVAIGAPITALAVSPDDRFLVSGLRDGRVVVATVSHGK